MSDDLELLYTCPLCGLDTPTPSRHVSEAHGFTLEQLMRHLEDLDRRHLEFERLILGRQELGAVCRLCGHRRD